MKRTQLVSGILLMSIGSAWAADFTDTAEVISAVPIYDRVSEPRKECWVETVDDGYYESPRYGQRSVAGPIIGGVVGGLLGSQVGRGNGAKAATAAGAIAGAIVGDRVGEHHQYRYAQAHGPREVQRCRTKSSYREVVTGYDVVYRYNGHDVRTRLPYDPGDSVKVGVAIIGGNGRSHTSHRY